MFDAGQNTPNLSGSEPIKAVDASHNNIEASGEMAPAHADSGLSIWKKTILSLTHEFEQTQMLKWVKELELIAEFRGQMLVAAKDQLGYFRVKGRIENRIQTRWTGLDAKQRPLKIMAWRDVPSEVKDLVVNPWGENNPPPTPSEQQTQPIISEAKTHCLDFDSFIVGLSNRSAAGLAKRLACAENIGANLAYFHGLQGTGKTHILKAIEHHVANSNKNMRVKFCSAEDFMTAYVDGARAGDTKQLRSSVRGVDLFLIDDVQLLAGKKGTDQELLSTIQSVTQNGGRVALSADVCAMDLQGLSVRLSSQLKGAVGVELQRPDSDLCRAILRQREALIHKTCPSFVLDEDMVDIILNAVQGTGRDIIGVLGSIYTESGFGDLSVSTQMVEGVIERYKGSRPQPTITQIKQTVMQVFSVTKQELEGSSKSRHHVYPRHIAMHLCRSMTGKSLPQIAFQFGKRDHTTVLSACRKVKAKLSKNDRQLRTDIERVITTLPR